ncbi:MAG: cryptochrome/photolyase family protein [Desulfomonilaceae bacterium]
MSKFIQALRAVNPDPANRRWIYVPYDQLSSVHEVHSREDPRNLGFILIENSWKAFQRPYHKSKLALILSNMRNFAIEQAKLGVSIRYVVGSESYAKLLQPLVEELGEIAVSRPAERELRCDLKPLVDKGAIRVESHKGWMTDSSVFGRSINSNGKARMDAFYRLARQKTGVLMEGEKPIGRKYSFDVENRRPWKGEPRPPEIPVFPRNDLKEEVIRLVEEKFKDHPGKIRSENLPCTLEDAHSIWSWAKEECLENFGPYEDAMSSSSSGLFHTRISALLNIGRLSASRVVQDVELLNIPFSSKEGFIRQVLGWREYVRHCHEFTDGFRVLDSSSNSAELSSRCSRNYFKEGSEQMYLAEPGASPNFLDSFEQLPPVFWGLKSGFNCLDSVVWDVWNEAYSHHITRLMILANFGSILDICPRQLTDWFWVAYQDAYDWVVEPNVFGMGLFAIGDWMTTKPYVSGAAYINKMSDYCKFCNFDPSENCPVTNLYWAYLNRHRDKLLNNKRLNIVMSALGKRDNAKKQYDKSVYRLVSRVLAEGETLNPVSLRALQ